MKKKIVIAPILFYRFFLSPFLKQVVGVGNVCRYNPTCSAYMVLMIKKYGMIRGGYRGIKRLLTCHPFS